jgi:tetratricopeptide (TPR) repeat protein
MQAQQSLGRLLTLNPEYQVHWIASFWARVDAAKQAALTPRFQTLAEITGNGSLALVVTEIKNRNQPESGTQWLDRWMETHPAIPEVVLFRARLDLPDRAEAIARLDRFPAVLDDANVQAQKARWSGLVGNTDQARALFRAALKTDPDRHQDRLTLALLEMQADQLTAAETHLKALLATERFRANAYYHLGELARTRQQFDLAIDRFLRVDRGELVVEARKQLASLALTHDEPDQAIRWFDEARLLYPGLRPQLTLAEAQFQTTNGMAEDAIPVLSQALAEDPDRRDVRYTRALAYEQMGDIANAENDLRQILDANPDDADALNALGYTLADRTNRYEEAYVLIEKALSQKPESPAILDSMGWVLFKLGRLEEALPYFERAWEIVQDHEIAAHYGEVLWSLGRTIEAHQIWEQGYQSNPESDKIRVTIDRLVNS